jgi:hypothetical protein
LFSPDVVVLVRLSWNNPMPESKADTVKRLRHQAEYPERHGKRMLIASPLLVDYDRVIMDAHSSIAEA